MKIRIKIGRGPYVGAGIKTFYFVEYFDNYVRIWKMLPNRHRTMKFVHRETAEEWVRLFKAVCGKKVRVVKSK